MPKSVEFDMFIAKARKEHNTEVISTMLKNDIATFIANTDDAKSRKRVSIFKDEDAIPSARYTLFIPGTKTNGKQYFNSEELNKAIGSDVDKSLEFRGERGAPMSTSFGEDKLDSVLSALIPICGGFSISKDLHDAVSKIKTDMRHAAQNCAQAQNMEVEVD